MGKEYHLSQRDLSRKLQLAEYDMDKNVITRIETNSRYANNIEIRALAHIFGVTCDYLFEERVVKKDTLLSKYPF